MAKSRIELTIALIFICAILVGLFLTSRIDLTFSSDLETFSGPRAYPGLVLSVMLVLFAGIATSQVRAALHKLPDGSDAERLFDRRTLWAVAVFGALLVFVAAFEHVGYILTIVPLLTCVALLCGAPSVWRALVVAVCLSGVCLFIFRFGLSTVLPEGWFGIDAIF